jgi:hypothetical protein
MVSLGHGNNVVVVPPIGGSKAYGIKLLIKREPRTGETCTSTSFRSRLFGIISCSVRDRQPSYPDKVKQAVNAQSIFHSDGAYTVPTLVDIDRLSLTPTLIGLAESQCMYELIHLAT